MTEDAWKAELEREGFVHLPGVLGKKEVRRLADISLQSVEDFTNSEDLVRTSDGTPLKLLYPLDKYPQFIEVLGRQEVRDIVDSMIPGTDSVLTWEDVLIKMPRVGSEVGVHQDIGLDPVRETVHSLGISLHDDDDNPVFFLPGSHRFGPLTKDAVGAIWRECKDRFQPVVTRAGDILVHNVHCLHYSEPNLSPNPRATWYLEFRSMSELLRNGPWSREWTYRRRAIWAHARAVGGESTGRDEPSTVREFVHELSSGRSSFRVPHVTETVRYDVTSPYNHFAVSGEAWRTSRVVAAGTHHVGPDGNPLYRSRFLEVLKFHAPGLAPVLDCSGAYHITPNGQPTYEARHQRTFGFYEDRAAVHSWGGWFHILPYGGPLYPERYAWCGNFQEGRCPVRTGDGLYFHVTAEGAVAYGERYRYAGDFRDGLAVVQREDGKHSHIDRDGSLLHGKWFMDLDVFHKNHARARDARGWHHVNLSGEPIYRHRFENVEPFYNGQARVQGFDGSLSVIDEAGETVLELRPPLRSPLEELSADMVGYWRTQTIRAGVELGVFEALPASSSGLEMKLGLPESLGARLLRGLAELGLVELQDDGNYRATERGRYLKRSHPQSLADAALMWAGDTYDAWSGATRALRTGRSSFTATHGREFFDRLGDDPSRLGEYHQALASYARHDYRGLTGAVDFGVHDHVLDAGGGTGELVFALLRAFPSLTGTVMDRPEVVRETEAPEDVAGRCSFIAGDLFSRWPVESDAVVLARVLHDWPDGDAARILERAREAMPRGGSLYVVEMALDESSAAGGLLDLNMLVTTGGAERSARQFHALLAGAGFEILDVAVTDGVSSVIRARAA